MIAANAAGGHFKRFALLAGQAVQSFLQFVASQFKIGHRLNVEPVEAPGVFDHGIIATCFDLGQNIGYSQVNRFVLRTFKGQQRVEPRPEIRIAAGKALDGDHFPTTLAIASRMGSMRSRLSFSAA